jgi:glycosyltransferase involved in cell wall biosynthesis
VLRDDPGCELQVVGAGMPDGMLAGVPGTVRALGHVPDLEPWFGQLRLTVAPLRFGAGAKGKVASSLAAGVPCIATAVAAEGMALRPGDHVLVADTPEGFAAAIRQAYHDPALWAHLSAGGLAYAAEALSKVAWQARLADTLQRIGL